MSVRKCRLDILVQTCFVVEFWRTRIKVVTVDKEQKTVEVAAEQLATSVSDKLAEQLNSYKEQVAELQQALAQVITINKAAAAKVAELEAEKAFTSRKQELAEFVESGLISQESLDEIFPDAQTGTAEAIALTKAVLSKVVFPESAAVAQFASFSDSVVGAAEKASDKSDDVTSQWIEKRFAHLLGGK